MNRSELKEIINAVIGKLKENTPASACGICFADNDPPITTYYAVGEEDPVIPGPKPEPTEIPKKTEPPVVTTRYSLGEEG